MHFSLCRIYIFNILIFYFFKLALIGCWISAALIKSTASFTKSSIISQNVAANPMLINNSFSDFEATRYACLIVAIAACVVSLLILLLNAFNMTEILKKCIKKVDWSFVVS